VEPKKYTGFADFYGEFCETCRIVLRHVYARLQVNPVCEYYRDILFTLKSVFHADCANVLFLWADVLQSSTGQPGLEIIFVVHCDALR
jgi:hypothetical protein